MFEESKAGFNQSGNEEPVKQKEKEDWKSLRTWRGHRRSK